jgi:hypothetical protein
LRFLFAAIFYLACGKNCTWTWSCYIVSGSGTTVLDLNAEEDLSRTKGIVGRLEQLVDQHYIFSCEHLQMFSRNVDGFPNWISGSTYPTDGNMVVFKDAIDRLKVKVGI